MRNITEIEIKSKKKIKRFVLKIANDILRDEILLWKILRELNNK